MKKLFFLGMIIVPVAATAILWVLITDGISCMKDSSSVKIEVNKIALSEISSELSKVDVHIDIENNNDAGALLEKMEYDIYLGYQDRWYWIGRGTKDLLEIPASDSADFIGTTNIEKSNLVDVVTGKFFGAEASEMKVEGHARFTVGMDSVEVEFGEEDTDPYKPLLEETDLVTEPVESGTQGAISE